MKNRIVIATFVFLSGLAACSDDGGDNGSVLSPASGAAVRLEGAIGLSTRAVIGSGYNEDLQVCFARRDETGVSPNTYGAWSVCPAVRSGGAGSRPIVFVDAQLYPADGRNIHLHGYYPADSVGLVEPNASTGKVTFTIDGKTDMMATGRITASGGTSSAAEVPVACTFYHLLTQLSFVSYSDEADKWGEIVKIEATDIALKQELDWTVETPLLTAVASSPTGRLSVQEIAQVIPQVEEGGTPPAPKGYILLPAADGFGTGDKTLWLEITTSKDGNGHEVEKTTRLYVTAPEGGFKAGFQHTISLFFTDGIGIEVTHVDVKPWEVEKEPELPV